jgi:squalene-hopene/tetraprenyl-beta-curcumene cyclase
MTYSGLKSMIYAGLTQDDPRVKAAIAYIKSHYTLDENPGQGQRGLYYYYQTFAKAMALLGKPTVTDSSGKEHTWRKDLVAALAQRQTDSGSWVNRDDRFMEGDPHIVTSYGLLALHAARPPKV